MEYVTDFEWKIEKFMTVASLDGPKILISEDFSINGTTASAYLVFCHSTMFSSNCCSIFICVKLLDKKVIGKTSVNLWVDNTAGERMGNQKVLNCRSFFDRLGFIGHEKFVLKPALYPPSKFIHEDTVIVRCQVRLTSGNAKNENSSAKPITISSDKILEGSLVIFKKTPFYVAKHLLISRSDYFKALLESGNREEKAGIFRLETPDKTNLSKFKHFIFVGHSSDDWTFNSVQRMYPLADKYKLDQLKTECKQRLLSTIGEIELLVCLKIGFIYDDNELKGHALDGLKIRFYSKSELVYFNSSPWINFAASDLKLALKIKVAAYKAVGILAENYSL